MSVQRIGTDCLRLARLSYRRCSLCEHRCGVDRAAGQRGFCQAPAEARVYRCRVECGEEVELIPSQLLYLSGCNLRCVFCIGRDDAFDPLRGQVLTSQLLADVAADGRERGARNIQWVGGEPTIHLPAILEAMAGCDPQLPIVWKSNFFATSRRSLCLAAVDVYVADLKLAMIPVRDRSPVWMDTCRLLRGTCCGRRKRGRLIVRHLLLPGQLSTAVIARSSIGCAATCRATPLRVMAGYLPRWHAASRRELASPLGREVGPQAVALAQANGLEVIV